MFMIISDCDLHVVQGGFIMKTTTKTLIFLIVMALADIVIPVPIAVFMLIYVLYQRPPWFRDLVELVYRG